MKKKHYISLGIATLVANLLLPCMAFAGKAAANLVVVADTRIINNPILLYFANVYNTSHFMMAVWAVVLTGLYGGFLGLVMDFIMSRTGLDLKSRKIVEH